MFLTLRPTGTSLTQDHSVSRPWKDASYMHLKRTLGLTSALAMTAALAACGSSSSTAGGSGGTPTIGDCTITGKPNSISITPVKADTLTVETTLPAPGWWNGTTPGSINGGYEYCMAGNLA